MIGYTYNIPEGLQKNCRNLLENPVIFCLILPDKGERGGGFVERNEFFENPSWEMTVQVFAKEEMEGTYTAKGLMCFKAIKYFAKNP